MQIGNGKITQRRLKVMKTVKEVSEITGISIRALRYYDEIGILEPTALTEANYRLYDDKALERLQQILFFRELEVPLEDIKAIIENPNYDKGQALLTQKSLLEHKRNRLNGIIELIADVMKGVNTMSFEAFNDEDVTKIIDHSLEALGEDSIEALVKKYGSIEAFRVAISKGLRDEKTSAHLIKLYGSKEKAVESSLQAPLSAEATKELREEYDKIYRQFARAKEADNEGLATETVEQLADNCKRMFRLDNARYLLLRMANDYLHNSKLAEATNGVYGNDVAEYVGRTIQQYYGM